MNDRMPALLGDLVHERYVRLTAHATLLAGSMGRADDLVHAALVSVFSSRARFEGLDEAEALVRDAIAAAAVRGVGRRRPTKLGAPLATAPDPVSRDAVLADPDALAALSHLDPRQRVCVVLRHVDGLSATKTAAVLRLGEDAVDRYTSDGAARLAEALSARSETARSAPVHASIREVRDDR